MQCGQRASRTIGGIGGPATVGPSPPIFWEPSPRQSTRHRLVGPSSDYDIPGGLQFARPDCSLASQTLVRQGQNT